MSQTWLLFLTQLQADAAQAQITQNYGFPDDGTQRWAIPRQISVGLHIGKWAFAKPRDEMMAGVTGHEEADYDPGWWPDED